MTASAIPSSFDLDTAAEDFAAPGREIQCPVTLPGEDEAAKKFGIPPRRQMIVRVGEWRVSAVWGSGTYCTAARPGGGFPSPSATDAPKSSPDAEVAAWKGDGKFIELHGDHVEGWISPASFIAALEAAARDDEDAIRAVLVRRDESDGV